MREINWDPWIRVMVSICAVVCLVVSCGLILYVRWMHYQHYPWMTEPQITQAFFPQLSVAVLTGIAGAILLKVLSA